METAKKDRDTVTIGISQEKYNAVKKHFHASEKNTLKEAADELIGFGVGVNNGEYVKAKQKKGAVA